MDSTLFLERAATQTGFIRERFVPAKAPSPEAMLAIPFFGDLRAEAVLSSLLLHRLREVYPGKYLVMCGWPGHGVLFPYVDEYWGVRGPGMVAEAVGFDNPDQRAAFHERSLTRCFDCLPADWWHRYWASGLTSEFFATFKQVSRFRPGLTTLRAAVAKPLSQAAVVVYPARRLKAFHHGRWRAAPCAQAFYEELLGRLTAEGFAPAVYQDAGCHDLSPRMAGRYPFIPADRMADTLAGFRAVGCVLDVFSGVSRLALAARCPFVVATEKAAHIDGKDYEMDELCGGDVPHRYIFSFSTMLESGNWAEVMDYVVSKLRAFLPTLDRSCWPESGETFTEVPYQPVRQMKAKMLGTKLFKVKKPIGE